MSAQWEHRVLTYGLGWKGHDYDRIEQDLDRLGREALDTISPSIGSAASTIVVILKRANS